MRATLALLVATLAVACAPEDRDSRIGVPTLVERLERGIDLYAYEGGAVVIEGRYEAGSIQKGGVAVIPILAAEGRIQLDPDGLMWLEALEIELADVVVTPNTVPIHLTGLKVTMVERVGALPRWTGFDLGRIELHGEATVELDWAIDGANGVIAPLLPARLGPLELVVALRRAEAGALVVGQVSLVGEGVLWSWADLLYLKDAAAGFDVTDHRPVGPVE